MLGSEQLNIPIGCKLWRGYPRVSTESEGLARLYSHNFDFAQVVVDGENHRVDSFPSQRSLAPLKAATATPSSRLLTFFPKPDCYVSGNFPISPHCGCGVHRGPLTHWHYQTTKQKEYQDIQTINYRLLCWRKEIKFTVFVNKWVWYNFY